jgi:hypothetical protein
MKQIPLLFILTGLLSASTVLAQTPNTLICEYDGAGNRIVRKTMYIASGSRLAQPTSTGEADMIVESPSLYPNPATDHIVLSIPPHFGKENLQVEIYDLTGKLYLRQSVTSGESHLAIADLAIGSYFLLLRKNESVVSTHKWTKED